MHPLIETILIAATAILGALIGKWFSNRTSPTWVLGYVLPMILICCYVLVRNIAPLEFVAPFSWLVAGRTEFAIGAFIGPMTLVTPLSRLPRKETRRLVLIFTAFMMIPALWLFSAPAFNRNLQASLITNIDVDGICLQSTDYNCGPASAVTGLRFLGFPAEEGELAILARTSNASGTPPDILHEVLKETYPASLKTDYRYFESLDEIPKDGITLALIKFGFLVDHYVAILEINETEVVVGDPLTGLERHSHEAFLDKWRHTGITLQRVDSN